MLLSLLPMLLRLDRAACDRDMLGFGGFLMGCGRSGLRKDAGLIDSDPPHPLTYSDRFFLAGL